MGPPLPTGASRGMPISRSKEFHIWNFSILFSKCSSILHTLVIVSIQLVIWIHTWVWYLFDTLPDIGFHYTINSCTTTSEEANTARSYCRYFVTICHNTISYSVWYKAIAHGGWPAEQLSLEVVWGRKGSIFITLVIIVKCICNTHLSFISGKSLHYIGEKN